MKRLEETAGIFSAPFEDGLESLVAAAHELKSPLCLVRQLSLSISDGNLSDLDKKQLADRLTLTSERALRLTSDLTKTVRLKDAMFELEPINPYQLCRDIVHELQPYMAAHGRKLSLVSCSRSLLTIANRDLLRRIIMNFSDNAVNYTDISSTIELSVKSKNKGDVVRLGVRDYGPPIHSSISRKLKRANLEINTNLYSRPQSSGLGLYIASQFADAMNGKVGMTRHHDGVTFYVELKSSRQLSLI